MSKDMALIPNSDLLFDPKNLTKETIKQYLCPLANDQELTMGLQIAKTFNLNPLKREVYFVKYGKEPMAILTGYEVYLKRAERSGKYGGMKTWTTGSVQTEDLVGHVEVYRTDWEKPLAHEADYFEYVQMKPIYQNDKKVGEEPNRIWKSKPKTMIKKVAVSQAFRLAFPDEFDGMPYTTDEVIDTEKVIDVKVEGQRATQVAAPVSEAQSATHDPNEEKINNDQGVALLNMLKNNNYTKDDLKAFISFEFDLDSILEIRNKHLLRIKEAFSRPNPKSQPQEVAS